MQSLSLTRRYLIGWNMIYTLIISVLALWVFDTYNVFFPSVAPIHQLYFSIIGILISLLLANTERKRIRLVEKLSMFDSSIISLALTYDQQVPTEKNTPVTRAYFADGLNTAVSAFKKFLESTTQGNLDLYTMSNVDLDDAIDNLSWRNEHMRTLGVAPNEIARANQYLNKMSDTIEFVRLFKFYTSSKLIRRFLICLIVLGIIAFTPYYLTIPTIGPRVGPSFAIIFSAALNIQKILDNPVDGTEYIDQIQTTFEARFRMRIQEILFDEDESRKMFPG